MNLVAQFLKIEISYLALYLSNKYLHVYICVSSVCNIQINSSFTILGVKIDFDK